MLSGRLDGGEEERLFQQQQFLAVPGSSRAGSRAGSRRSSRAGSGSRASSPASQQNTGTTRRSYFLGHGAIDMTAGSICASPGRPRRQPQRYRKARTVHCQLSLTPQLARRSRPAAKDGRRLSQGDELDIETFFDERSSEDRRRKSSFIEQISCMLRKVL